MGPYLSDKDYPSPKQIRKQKEPFHRNALYSNHRCTAQIQLDLSKAFDSLSVIRSFFINWAVSLLLPRSTCGLEVTFLCQTQAVRIGSVVSSPRPTSHSATRIHTVPAIFFFFALTRTIPAINSPKTSTWILQYVDDSKLFRVFFTHTKKRNTNSNKQIQKNSSTQI